MIRIVFIIDKAEERKRETEEKREESTAAKGRDSETLRESTGTRLPTGDDASKGRIGILVLTVHCSQRSVI